MAVAERLYARALFRAADEKQRVDAVLADLGAFAEAVASSPELAAFLANPQVDRSAKASVLGELAEGAEELVRNFLRLIAEKGRSGQIPAIHAELQALVDQAQGRVAVELTTAFELSDDEAAAIVKQIENASGRTVEATRKVDPELVGGLILQAGSLRVDASVRGRLERLRHELVTR
ncbi:ATP synthase F1, delta subunit [Gaiella occulta]|uniref:ATP synthase subunit delta n=1 Tax=Gaiella occulta TaxID=1002870 RepID=A0A7M2YZ03_9ACTN|nr:ATP synthase F1 subunit delta [Gaiella occulta]RDI75385.1 ATP synthase F1, delta subunit [Gaiella occulta]